jgi:SIR2-like domain
MNEWARLLREACGTAEARFPDAMGLKDGISSEEFERIVGEALALKADLPLLERFKRLGTQRLGASNSHVAAWKKQLSERLTYFERVLRETLYREFGVQAVDRSKCRLAIESLMEALHGHDGVQFATTNYDRCLEAGLEERGTRVRDGFEARSGLETPRLNPEGLSRWASEEDPSVTVIHLHGAVGWYATGDGGIVSQYADQPFNPTLGTPVILPPDPNKDPARSGFVKVIWGEFTKALAEATHVLVLGHSLHDRAMLEAFSAHAPNARFAVSFLTEPNAMVPGDVRTLFAAGEFKQLRGAFSPGFAQAAQFQLKLSPEADLSVMKAWIEST